jgi:hypothetical protein
MIPLENGSALNPLWAKNDSPAQRSRSRSPAETAEERPVLRGEDTGSRGDAWLQAEENMSSSSDFYYL